MAKAKEAGRLQVRSVRLLNADALDQINGGTASSAGGTGSGACISRGGGCGTAAMSECGGCCTYYCCSGSCCGSYTCV
jgi:hypothetical protein